MPPRRRQATPAVGLQPGDIVATEGRRTRKVVTSISDGKNYQRLLPDGTMTWSNEPKGWAQLADIDGSTPGEWSAASPSVLRRIDNPDAATIAAARNVAPEVTGRRNGTPNVGGNVSVPGEAPIGAARSSES